MARRHHRSDGQLRCRLRAGRRGSPRLPDPTDGRCRGHPRGGPDRRHPVGLGDLPRVPRQPRCPPVGPRPRHPGAPRRTACLRHARAGDRRRHPRRHRRDGHTCRRGLAGRCARLLHLAHTTAQGGRWRTRARHIRHRRRTPCNRSFDRRGRPWRLPDRHPPPRGARLVLVDARRRPDHRPAGRVQPQPARLRAGPVARGPPADRAGPGRRAQHPRPGVGPAGRHPRIVVGHRQPVHALPHLGPHRSTARTRASRGTRPARRACRAHDRGARRVERLHRVDHPQLGQALPVLWRSRLRTRSGRNVRRDRRRPGGRAGRGRLRPDDVGEREGTPLLPALQLLEPQPRSPAGAPSAPPHPHGSRRRRCPLRDDRRRRHADLHAAVLGPRPCAW